MKAVDRLVAREALAWCLVSLVASGGLVWLMGAVESARRGGDALLLAALKVPDAVVPLSPLIAALGVALAAARLESRGERVALEASGWPPRRTALPAAAVGLLLGLCSLWAADGLVPWASRAAARVEGRAPVTWVWTDEGAVRLRDGLRVRATEGRVLGVDHLEPAALASPELARAASVQRPRTATGDALAGEVLAPAVVERTARLARVLATALLAAVGWWPWSRRGTVQIGATLALGAGWQVLDSLGQSFAAQGLIAPSLGAGAGVAALAVACLLVCMRAPVSR